MGIGYFTALEGYFQYGTISVPANTTSVPLNFNLPAGSPLDSSIYLSLKLQDGTTSGLAKLDIELIGGAPFTFQNIAVNWEHSCGISSGKLYCWGSDYRGQLGLGAGSQSTSTPTQIGTSNLWTQVETGGLHTCGLNAGALYCWGRDADGQVGNGAASSNDLESPAQIGADTNWTEVALGYEFTCGIESGRLFCWGIDSYGQAANGGGVGNTTTAPLQIGVSTTWTHIGAGSKHACGIDNGSLYCWGEDSVGQVGNGSGTSTDVDAPTQIGILTNWTAIDAGSDHTCGIESGALYCWGNNSYGAVGNGDGSTADIHSPEQIGVSTNWTDVDVGDNLSCGINNGELYCWGEDYSGGIGDGPESRDYITSPKKIGDKSDWVFIVVGDNHACAIDTSNTYCWGHDSKGQLGLGANSAYELSFPQRVTYSTDWTWVDSYGGASTTCGINKGRLYCWGSAINGKVPNGLVQSVVPYPEPIGVLQNWSLVSVGSLSGCGIESGRLFCWGHNEYGVVGNNGVSGNDYLSPVQIGSDSDWFDVQVARDTACGIRSPGQLYCWGIDDNGQMGNGPILNATILAPQRVGSSESWTSVGITRDAACGVDSGRLFCWGYDGHGQLGNGSASTANVDTPEQIGTDTDWKSVFGGNEHFCSIKTDNSVYCWGYDDYGRLGDGGGSVDQDTPVKIGTDTSWTYMAPGQRFACGINNGERYCWGRDHEMGLGNGYGTSSAPSSPTLSFTDPGWSMVTVGSVHGCGIKNSGLYCWGRNDYSQTGFLNVSEEPTRLGIHIDSP